VVTIGVISSFWHTSRIREGFRVISDGKTSKLKEKVKKRNYKM
jgi:hypothetical protein